VTWASSDRAARLPADWARRRARILRRDHHRCQIAGPGCTRIATEVDHIDHGDNHDPANLQAVCSRCHRAKTQGEAAGAQSAARARSIRPREAHPGLT
jgi:5-methylcytosine-specific restriction enzyme A